MTKTYEFNTGTVIQKTIIPKSNSVRKQQLNLKLKLKHIW